MGQLGSPAREPDREIAEEPDRGRRRRRPHHRARHRQPHQAAGAALPGHRRAGHHDLHRLARRGACRGRIRADRAAGTRAAGPRGPAGDPVLLRRRRRLHQPPVRGRHGHGPHADRRDRAHEPAAAAAARCHCAADLAGPGRRRRPERHAVLVLRAAEARHAGPGRELPARGRGPVPLAHRVHTRRRQHQHQRRCAGRAAHRVRSLSRGGARHPDPDHGGGGRQRRRRIRRISPNSAAASTRCASRAATVRRTSANWCSTGATAGPCACPTSRRSPSSAATAIRSPCRTATRRSRSRS